MQTHRQAMAVCVSRERLGKPCLRLGEIFGAVVVCARIYTWGSGALVVVGGGQTDGSTHWIMSPVRSLQACMSLTVVMRTVWRAHAGPEEGTIGAVCCEG